MVEGAEDLGMHAWILEALLLSLDSKLRQLLCLRRLPNPNDA